MHRVPEKAAGTQSEPNAVVEQFEKASPEWLQGSKGLPETFEKIGRLLLDSQKPRPVCLQATNWSLPL